MTDLESDVREINRGIANGRRYTARLDGSAERITIRRVAIVAGRLFGNGQRLVCFPRLEC